MNTAPSDTSGQPATTLADEIGQADNRSTPGEKRQDGRFMDEGKKTTLHESWSNGFVSLVSHTREARKLPRQLNIAE